MEHHVQRYIELMEVFGDGIHYEGTIEHRGFDYRDGPLVLTAGPDPHSYGFGSHRKKSQAIARDFKPFFSGEDVREVRRELSIEPLGEDLQAMSLLLREVAL